MSEYLIQDTTLTGIADKIRPLLGLTGTMTPEQMQTNLTTEQANITAALAALAEKGVTVPAGANSNALAGLIGAIESGGGKKIEVQTLTPSENITKESKFSVSHGLGVVPHFGFIMATKYPANNSSGINISCMILKAPFKYVDYQSENTVYYASSYNASSAKLKCGSKTTNSDTLNGLIDSTSGPFSAMDAQQVTLAPVSDNLGACLLAGVTYYIVLGTLWEE